MRFIRGLVDATGHALVGERGRAGPGRDLADLCHRSRAFLTPEAITALIMAGACDAWGIPRRQLLWILPATWRNATGLPLPIAVVPLPEETPPERVATESWATGLPLTAHPIATIRPSLDRAGLLTTAALNRATEGATVTVAGLAIVAQQPPTARGVVFLSLEDECASASAILSPTVAKAQRAALRAAPVLLVTGVVQRRGPMTNLLVRTIAPWGITASRNLTR